MKKKIILEIIAMLYVCLFLYTGISKLINYDLSIEQNSVMPLVGPYTEIFSWLLPVFEIAIAIIIFIPKTRYTGQLIGTALMIFFTGYVLYIMNYNSQLPCTCGGFIQALSWQQHLVFNIIISLLGIIAIILTRGITTYSKIDSVRYTN